MLSPVVAGSQRYVGQMWATKTESRTQASQTALVRAKKAQGPCIALRPFWSSAARNGAKCEELLQPSVLAASNPH